MAQPQQSYPPRTFSPLQTTSPPSHPSFLGASKRQRLSPHAQSPYSPPSIPNIALPNQLYSSPRYGSQLTESMAYDSRTPSNHQPQNGAMGPPSRPTDKPTDMNELSDVLAGSGVDLKEEEAALLGRFNLPSQRQPAATLSSNFGATLNTGISTTYNSFNLLSQSTTGDRASPYGMMTPNQPAVAPQPAEDLAASAHRRAIRSRAEKLQHHASDPFLASGWVQQRLWHAVKREGITKSNPGLARFAGHAAGMNEISTPDLDINGLLSTSKGQDSLSHDAPLVEFFTLISLAAKERLRGLLEEAATLAKGRRMGSHGVVPLELTELAAGLGDFGAVTALPTPGNSAVSPKSNPLKRSFESMTKPPTPLSNSPNTPSARASVPNITAKSLRDIATSEKGAEEERLAKRARVTAAGALAGESGRLGSISVGTSRQNTPGLLGERAPDVDTKKTSKKDQKKQAEAKATEAEQHAETNKTMNLTLDLGGSLGKKLSWMQKDTSSNRSVTPVLSRVNTNTQGSLKVSAVQAARRGHQLASVRKHGEFREDKEDGSGIQVRDVVMALEADDKEKRALIKAYARLH